MKNRKQLAIICATVLGLSGLMVGQNAIAVEQTNKSVQQEKLHDKPHRGQGHHKAPHHFDANKKAEFEQHRHQFYEQSQQACQGKLGQTVEFKINQQTFKGQCELAFKPKKPEAKPDLPPVDAKKDRPKFSREQRQAMEQQVQQVCKDKVGQTVSITLDNQLKIDGTCEVRFQRKKPEQLKDNQSPK